LLDAGLFVSASARARALLLDYLARVDAPRVVRVVPRLGWHDTAAGRVFVLPEGPLGATGSEDVMLQTERPDALPPLRRAGRPTSRAAVGLPPPRDSESAPAKPLGSRWMASAASPVVAGSR